MAGKNRKKDKKLEETLALLILAHAQKRREKVPGKNRKKDKNLEETLALLILALGCTLIVFKRCTPCHQSEAEKGQKGKKAMNLIVSTSKVKSCPASK